MIFYPIVAAFNFLHNSLGANIFFSFSDDMGMKNYLFSVLAQVILILFWYLFHRFMGERLSRTCDATYRHLPCFADRSYQSDLFSALLRR